MVQETLGSAAKALEKASGELGGKVIVTSKPSALASASHIVLPGVGAFPDCRRGLEVIDGMIEALADQVYDHASHFWEYVWACS